MQERATLSNSRSISGAQCVKACVQKLYLRAGHRVQGGCQRELRPESANQSGARCGVRPVIHARAGRPVQERTTGEQRRHGAT